MVKAPRLLDGGLQVAAGGEGDGGGSDRLPFLAERLDDSGQHEAFDVGAWGVVRT